jgi:hypothetical protein
MKVLIFIRYKVYEMEDIHQLIKDLSWNNPKDIHGG